MWVNASDSIWSYFLNLVFNGVDIYAEAVVIYQSYMGSNWEQLGTYLGKVLADVYFNNPTNIQWSYENSEYIGPVLKSSTHRLAQSHVELHSSGIV